MYNFCSGIGSSEGVTGVGAGAGVTGTGPVEGAGATGVAGMGLGGAGTVPGGVVPVVVPGSTPSGAFGAIPDAKALLMVFAFLGPMYVGPYNSS